MTGISLTRIFFSLVLLLFALCAVADEVHFHYPAIRHHGKRIADFVPIGWHTFEDYGATESHGHGIFTGDLQGKKLSDVAMVIEYDKNLNPGPASPGKYGWSSPRILLVLFQTPHGDYQLSLQNTDLILRANEGGARGDPLYEIAINRGCLIIHFDGGSTQQWESKERFRFQHNGWYLIGITDLHSGYSGPVEVVDDYNLLTGKLKVTSHNFDTDEQKTHWLTPGKRIISLEQAQHWLDHGWKKMTEHAHHKLGGELE